jgi:glycosyltransferase involved in cell wall biosynthesis
MDHLRPVLVFEPEREGHPTEWLQHLIRFAATEGRGAPIYLLAARSVCKDLAEDVSAAGGRVRLIPLGESEQALCTHRSLMISSFSRWWVMRRYMARTDAAAGHFLCIDHLTLPLALGLGLRHRAISGTLFRPSVHYAELGSARAHWAERLRNMRKSILYRLALRHPDLGRMLTLDPYFPRFAAIRFRQGEKVRWLPDPVHPPVNCRSDDRRLLAVIPANLTVLLLFGHITERKGVLTLLAALRGLRPETTARIGVVIAGRIDAEVKSRMQTVMAALARERPYLWLHVEDRRLSSGELYSLVERADVVLAPYQRFVGSSGVLLWAARAGKPLVTQDFGLLGRLVRDYRLGIVADTLDLRSLRAGIEMAVAAGGRQVFDRQSADSFLAQMTPQRFAAEVFASLHDVRCGTVPAWSQDGRVHRSDN